MRGKAQVNKVSLNGLQITEEKLVLLFSNVTLLF